MSEPGLSREEKALAYWVWEYAQHDEDNLFYERAVKDLDMARAAREKDWENDEETETE